MKKSTNSNGIEATLTWGDKIRNFIIIVLIFGVVSVVIYFDPVGKLLGSWMTKAQNTSSEVALRNIVDLLNGLVGLVGLVIIAFVSLMVRGYFSERSRAERKRPKFFEEMQSTLRAILIPLGFEEREGANNNRTRTVNFSRDRLIVELILEVMDGIYHVRTSSRYDKETRQEKFQAVLAKHRQSSIVDLKAISDEIAVIDKPDLDDFSIEGAILEADKFKTEAITKLKEWLYKGGDLVI